jgi:hypothetical protein
MRQSWGIRVAVVVAVGVVAVGGCTAPADPEHVAYSAVTSGCSGEIRVGVGQFRDDFDPAASADRLRLVEPGERAVFHNPLVKPVEGSLFLWVVSPSASAVAEPVELPVALLGTTQQPSGTTVFEIAVAGDLCP